MAHDPPTDTPRNAPTDDPPPSNAPAGFAPPASLRPSHEWTRFDTAELAIVCSHYDLGILRSVKAFHRGSLRSPKVVLKSDGRAFLLKRRAPGRDDIPRVTLAHEIQEHLVRKRFPAPRIIPTRDGKGWVEWKGRVYEMFEYVRGAAFEPEPTVAEDAGKALGWFHRLAADFKPAWTPPGGTYHHHAGMARMLERLVARDAAFRTIARRLGQWYEKAAVRAEQSGVSRWPVQVIHGDWHPGNMIFQAGRIVGVIDYDAVRLGPRVIDAANGTLQFSIDRAGRDPDAWNDALALDRAGAFIRGYDGVEDSILSRAEMEALPWLMIEAMIVESLGPVAATGNFGGIDGLKFLCAVDRRVEWLSKHTAAVAASAG